jgi:hypothetical protein
MSVSVSTTGSFGSNKAARAQAELLAAIKSNEPVPLDPDFPYTVIAPPTAWIKGLAYQQNTPDPSSTSTTWEGS